MNTTCRYEVCFTFGSPQPARQLLADDFFSNTGQGREYTDTAATAAFHNQQARYDSLDGQYY